jgi:ABC-type multidrug transport system fused ATPase/permease subunit
MITRFKRSWELFKASITVTLRYRKLLWFPILTTFATAFIAFFFLSAMALPVVLHHTGYRLNQKQHWVALKDYYLPAPAAQSKPRDPAAGAVEALNVLLTGHSTAVDQSGQPVAARGFPWGSLWLLAIYLVSMFLATFFNVAFYSEIIAALNGKGVSFRRGLSAARSRLPSILAWSLLAGVVGWLIRAIEQRLPLAGRIVTGLIGMAWSIAAVFAIPVIIQEQPMRNPIKILQQSALTLKRTWGEGLIGYLGFSAGSLVVFGCSVVLLLAAGALALLLKSAWLMVIAGLIWVLGLFFMAYISSVAGHVYRCALYLYATEGVVPEPYSQELMDMAWKVKKS